MVYSKFIGEVFNYFAFISALKARVFGKTIIRMLMTLAETGPRGAEAVADKKEGEPRRLRAAYMFLGQGLQYSGMGNELCQESEAARDTYEEADDILGWSVSQMSFRGPDRDLIRPKNLQAALMTFEIAAYRAFSARSSEMGLSIQPIVGGGISLGETVNPVAADVYGFRTALDFINVRGLASEDYIGKGGMISVLGLSQEEAIDICNETGVVLGISYPKLPVFSYANESLDRFNEALARRGKKGNPVSNVLYHHPAMIDAQQEIEEAIAGISFENPRFPIIAGDGRILRSGAEIKAYIPTLFTSRVNASKGMTALQTFKPDVVIEFAPRPLLATLFRKDLNGIPIMCISDGKSLNKATGDLLELSTTKAASSEQQ